MNMEVHLKSGVVLQFVWQTGDSFYVTSPSGGRAYCQMAHELARALVGNTATGRALQLNIIMSESASLPYGPCDLGEIDHTIVDAQGVDLSIPFG